MTTTNEPMTVERLAEIRRNVAEVADYIGDRLMSESSAHRDRRDLLAEVDRLRARIAKARDLHGEFKMYGSCGHLDHGDGDDFVILANDGTVCRSAYQYSICRECCAPGDEQSEDCASEHDHTECWPCPTRQALDGAASQNSPDPAAVSH